MTYTFKLARRLAVSRNYAMYIGLALLAACAGDATAPESGGLTLQELISFRVVPSAVTVETGQPIRFRGEGLTRAGKVFAPTVSWEVSGGTMNSDGTFTSAEPGQYVIVGRGRGKHKPDTSVVVVIPPQPDVTAIEVSPDQATLAVSANQTFTASGRLPDGTTVPVAVSWKATGGNIDAGGVYRAGNSPGTYRVIARNSNGKLADTATVTIAEAEAPAPPPSEPEPPPATPTLDEVIITPASASLVTGGTKQFSALGRNSVGDSVGVSVTFAATGGTVTSGGLYTAGATAGSYRVIASTGGLADTALVTLTAPAPTGAGISYGSFHLPKELYGVGGQSGALKALSPSTASTELAAAKARNARLVVSLPGSRLYYTNSDGTFSLSLWKSQMDRWRSYTSLLREYHDNGTILLNYLVDEPNCLRCWGGQSIPHATLQEMTRYAKELFPFLPTAIRVVPGWLKSTPSWPYLDAAWAQYEGPRHKPSYRMTPEQFRDQNVADAKAINVALVLGLNTLDGGDGSSRTNGTFALDPDLSDAPSDSYRYQMSVAEFEYAGKVFAATPYACAVLNWRYSATMTKYPSYVQEFDLRSDVKAAAQRIGEVAAGRQAKSCRKPGT